jgi:capsular polysaccharide biosynthesis protein
MTQLVKTVNKNKSMVLLVAAFAVLAIIGIATS